MPKLLETELVVAIPELQKRLGLSRTAWRHEVEKGALPTVKIGGRHYATRAAIEAYIARLTGKREAA